MRGVKVKKETKEKIRNTLLNKKWNEERKNTLKNSMWSSEIRQKQLEGINRRNECEYKITTPENKEYVIISTIMKLEKILPISHASIKRLIYNKRSSIKGWKIEKIPSIT
jgi:hypothetical protein